MLFATRLLSRCRLPVHSTHPTPPGALIERTALQPLPADVVLSMGWWVVVGRRRGIRRVVVVCYASVSDGVEVDVLSDVLSIVPSASTSAVLTDTLQSVSLTLCG